MFEHGSIAELAAWLEGQVPADRPVAASDVGGEPVREVVAGPVSVGGDLVGVVRDLVAVRLGVPSSGVDVAVGYYELGLGSADLLALVAELEERLSVSLSPTVMFEHGSIAELAAWLEGQVPADRPATVLDGGDKTAAEPDRGTAPADRPSVLRSAVVDEVAALLDVSAQDVDPDAELRDFGLDWTGLARLADRLNARFGTTLTSADFVEHRTVSAVSAHLAHTASGAEASTPLPPRQPGTQDSVAAPGPRAPHPMLHETTESDATGVTYRTRLNGSEPYLRDHQVRGVRVLPGVAHLEMARAAVTRFLGRENSDAVQLTDVVWLRPAVCGPDGLELRVTVRTTPGGCEFVIHCPDTADGDAVCSQGRASVSPAGRPDLPRLEDVRAACAQRTLSAAHVYDVYAGLGLDYGPAQRSLAHLGIGVDDSGRPQVLAELSLPTVERLDDRLLHPAVLDGALQATIGLWLGAGPADGRGAGLALPFALERLDVAAATPTRSYAWIRHRPDSGTDTAAARLDVTLFDQHGRVCVDLSGLSTRVLPQAAPGAEQARETASTPEPDLRGATEDRTLGEPTHRPAAGAPLDIAVVGVSGRYPEAADLDAFWENLRSGRDCIREVPAERWNHRRYADGGGPVPGRWGGFLDDIDRFDPLFFNISLLEAEHLDPQERLFLQCAHHVLEDAGYTGDRLSRAAKVGVFVGVMYQEYQLYGAQAQERGRPVALWGSAATVANRVSYFYDFHGPSMAVDTMCSSSLTAIHLACEAIRSGQCGAAIAGGVNLSPHPNKYLMLSQRQFLSTDGRCRSFGAGGDGYVPGEGVGAVLLKPLERAVADGDHIYGVIKGTALNHGGRTSGYSVPTPVAQGEVIADAFAAAGVDPRAVSYLEAHGTGTSLGDPIEIAGLDGAFRRAGGRPRRCAIGSVKSNIGHAESAAGIAGVTKVLLQMRHAELVPSLHSGTLNPHIDFARTPFHVQQRLESWERPTLETDGTHRALPRIAGVSSFGGGGSNAHVVIAEYDPPAPPAAVSADDRPSLIVLSARTEAQLVESARRLRDRLGELDEGDLPHVAWTLQTGRMELEERLAFAAPSLAAARAVLESFVTDPGHGGVWVRDTVPPHRETDGEALRAAVTAWSRHGRHDTLLALWAAGATVEWETVHPSAASARRISLPGYPFARERCWVDLDTAEPDTPLAPLAPPQRADTPRTGQDTSGGLGGDRTVRRPDDTPDTDEVLLLRPVWAGEDEAPREGAADATGPERFSEQHVVLVGRVAAGERDAFRAALPARAVCHFVEVEDTALDRQYTQLTRHVFTLVRELLERGVRRPTLFQVALVGGPETGLERERLGCFRGLAGLLKSAQLEQSLLHTQYVECLDGASPAAVAARLAAESTGILEPEVRHRDGQRYVVRLAEADPAGTARAPWKEDGVYLVTGGAGALGLLVAKDIAAAVGHATVVLAGRSPLDEERREALGALRAAGLTVDYRRTDVSDRAAVGRLLEHIADNHGPLTGVLHSAGVIDDKFILRKSPEELQTVLAPKVSGLVHLDELTEHQPLDLFVCFSSIGGAFGNPGQADYAAANAFMDGYAAYRTRLVEAGLRHGRTLSVGWPFWDEGGMGADGPVREQLRGLGLAPLDTARGLATLRWALTTDGPGSEAGTLLVVAGRRRELLSRFPGHDLTPPAAHPVDAPPAAAQAATVRAPEAADEVRGLEERAVKHLRRMVAAALKLAPERVDADTPLERYGMDSVMAVNLTSRLEETFGPLSRTLLFEVQTVRRLAQALAEQHTQALRTLLGEPRTPRPTRAHSAEGDAERAPAPPAHPAAGRAVRRSGGEEIAVIGISGRYPHADDLDAFWANLRAGRDSVTEVPADRWDLPDRAAETGRGMWGAFLDGVDRFDPLHFGISPREAAAMDPQQRLFLETAWHLLEQSGVTQDVIEERYGRRVGVYVGAAYLMYRADASDPVLAALTSSASYNLIANRVSHFFGLQGPSLAVDSMCTSSAMAVHLACSDLLRGECELALAGGVNLTLHPDKFVALDEMQLLGSHTGSRSFRDGDGYLPAEAVGAVLLKPLDAALRDGDTIHAVIKSTASMHAGRSNGFMTPSHRTQVDVMRRALERAGTTPDSIGYVEAAANGTTFADEVELRALREVFADSAEPVPVGTVKSNLGHPEAASGIAQLTKVVLQLRHQELAPLVDTGAPNPNLELADTPLRLCDRLTPWEPRGDAAEDGSPAPLRALVNSVAAGGSHVSLVVEAPPRPEAPGESAPDSGPQLVVLSARNRDRLRTAVQELHDHLVHDDTARLADVAYTLQLGREALPERLAVVVASPAELRQALAHALADGTDDDGFRAMALYRGNADEDAGPLGTLLSGHRGADFLTGLIADGDLERLAELWVRGARVPWRALHDGPRRLVPLPLTAFDRRSYWVGHRPAAPAAAGPAGTAPVPRTNTADAPQDGTLTGTERLMLSAWAELLQLEADQLGGIDVKTDFFSLGGNSLLATRLTNLLKQRTGVDLPVEAVFNAPRLADMAAELDRRTPTAEAAGALDADLILRSIDLVAGMSDEELDALDLEN
ncbi:SDR family NAD(P)-dependent oxidoreductase [Streptomyces sp. S.PNR 29]|uniref:SDR family NAD(P)-dependent oxidoreductase n=1 Tax=Streptomyces sp. S.PNR 29 TaxID=2973805 RepID=UPI0025B25E99|nr:SDR family NAD(P)-dependent oxidoreductase [Streptomyces sp. S.PNR 29]MDN0200051.1 SDR family NAD(P)-dependent oxidoreductase [Streptomyces sp. S.PNR 29]